MQCFRGSNILNLPQSIFWNKVMVFCTMDDELKVKSRVEWGFRDLFSMTRLWTNTSISAYYLTRTRPFFSYSTRLALDYFTICMVFAIEKLKFILRIDSYLTNLVSVHSLDFTHILWSSIGSCVILISSESLFELKSAELYHTWCQLSKICPILAVRINIWFFLNQCTK